ncbi:TetR/AcrR family transcriptional regulator [Pantoea agglomerans]|uniref:TetR/AcrR family transcriptional regulator n=1 Tax=Enterobacter agglomerans TaxID=549 RepID=UPI003C7B911D
MRDKKKEIIIAASSLFNREGYVNSSLDKIATFAQVSKMTLYKYFADKEAIILEVLALRRKEFIEDLRAVIASQSTPRMQLQSIFAYYGKCFAEDDFNGCMFARAVADNGMSSSLIVKANDDFKVELYTLLLNILRQTLKPEPAERCTLNMIILIDGAISLALSPSLSREYPPATLAWMAAKTHIFAQGGKW